MLYAGSDNNYIAPYVKTFQVACAIFLLDAIVDDHVLFVCHLRFLLRFFSSPYISCFMCTLLCVRIYEDEEFEGEECEDDFFYYLLPSIFLRQSKPNIGRKT